MLAPADLVYQTSTSTGTGDFTLASVTGKRSFSTVFGTGAPTNVFYYFISHLTANEWEVGTGHCSATDTLVRDTVIVSSNSNAKVNFSAGTKDVVNDVPASVLNGLAPLASPAFTGTPTAPTPANGESSTVLATTQFVKLVLAVGTYTTAIADGIVSYAKMATSAIATTAEYLSNTASKLLTPNVAWAAADWVTLTDGATVTPDFSAGINFNWALGAAGRTLANPTNMKNGQSGCIYLNAGASGTLTIWGSYWKFAGGVKPTLTPNSADVICYTVRTSTLIICTFIPDVR